MCVEKQNAHARVRRSPRSKPRSPAPVIRIRPPYDNAAAPTLHQLGGRRANIAARKGVITTYRPVINAELLALVAVRPAVWKAYPPKRASPAKAPCHQILRPRGKAKMERRSAPRRK